MALVKPTLTAALTSLFTELATNQDGEAARQRLVSGLADAIDLYLRSATVTVAVTTAGTAAAQTGTGTGSLS